MLTAIFRLSRRWVSLPLFASMLLASSNLFAQERDWQPQRTWVFIVGTLRWKHTDMFASFPQENRRDSQLVDFFRKQGVPAQQLMYLKDQQATTRRVKAAFTSLLSKTSDGDLLFFYFTGHGYKSDDGHKTFFAAYDAGDDIPGWSTESIIRDIDRYFKGSRALLTADSCYSGSLAAQIRKTYHRVSYAALTSSSANQLSTENWTFTEMLLAGFTGRAFADIDGDGQITLSELAEAVREDMAFAEDQRSSFTFTGRFSPGTVLARAELKPSPQVSRRVEVRPGGGWYHEWYKARIIDGRGGKFKVHYYGWQDSDDEWVRPNQIRNLIAPRDRWLTTTLSN